MSDNKKNLNIDKKALKEKNKTLKREETRLKKEKKVLRKKEKQKIKQEKKLNDKFLAKKQKEEKFLIKQKIKEEKVKKAHLNKIAQAKYVDWFKLDNAATIYPSIKDDNWSFVVRASVLLKEQVNPEVLQQALNDTMPRFPTFNVRLRKGIFWNYFEINNMPIKVEKETKFPCSTFNLFNFKGHIVRVLYYNNRISVECFHAISDLRAETKFFNSLLRRYFNLLGANIESSEGCLEILDLPRKEESEDAFFKYCDKSKKIKHKEEKAHKIQGTLLENGVVNATLGTMSTSKIKELAKQYNATVGEYLSAVVGYSVWKLNKNHKRPIKLSIPVDLRRFFPSATLRNFSGYVNVEIKPKQGDYTFEEILEIIKEEYKRINEKYLKAFINSNVTIQKNFFIKIVPLIIKNLIIKLCFKAWGEAYQTINISNIGLVNCPKEFSNYIEKYMVNLGRPKYNAKTIGIVSFDDKLCLTVSSKVKEMNLEEEIFKFLASQNLEVLIETNRRDIYGQ